MNSRVLLFRNLAVIFLVFGVLLFCAVTLSGLIFKSYQPGAGLDSTPIYIEFASLIVATLSMISGGVLGILGLRATRVPGEKE